MPVPFPVVPIVLASGLALARGLAVAYERSTHATLLEALRSGTTREVRAVENGELARIVGKAELAERTLTAPLSGRTCFAWQVSVWAPLTTRAWTKMLDHAEHVPFSVVDATGRAVIETRRVRSYAAVDHEERGSGAELTEGARAFFASRKIEPSNARVLHLKESALLAGEPTVVVGYVKRRDDDGARSVYREPAELTEIHLVAPRFGSLLFSDAPEAIDPVPQAGGTWWR